MRSTSPDKLLAASLVILCFAFAPRVAAHDYWIEPDSFMLPPYVPTMLHLHMGDHFTSEQERPLQLARTVRFALFVGDVTTDLTVEAEDGRSPLLRFTPEREGTHLFVMERTPQRIELPAKEFDAYLREEKLETIIRLRASSRMANNAGRERYTRYLKAIVQVGTQRTEDYTRIVGQRLEIVPLRNPYQMRRGDPLRFKILLDGQPLAGARVAAYNRAEGKSLAARTNRAGVVSFRLDTAGAWLVRLVHMRPCANCTDADWESFWGACTFALR